jgi:cephalosporin hydroxylase
MTKYNPPDEYISDIKDRLIKEANDRKLEILKADLLNHMNWRRYAYNFCWMGRPIIQIPQDTMTFQEIIWKVCPDLIIETGIAHGGSLVFSASMLALLEKFGLTSSPVAIGVDVDIRRHNREAIENHPASPWIQLFEGSSVCPAIVSKIRQIANGKARVMVFLDSDHTHDHVLAELRSYAPLVSVGSFLVVLDTGIEDIDPSAVASGRPWCKGNSPKSALQMFLSETDDFTLDNFYHEKAWVTSAPGGIIQRVK